MISTSEPGIPIPPTVFKVINAVAFGAGTDVAVWTPAAGKKFRLLMYVLTSTAATAILFKDGTGGPIVLADALLVANTRTPTVDLGGKGVLSATAGNALVLNCPTASTLTGFVAGVEQ